jgi:hypothetical protein
MQFKKNLTASKLHPTIFSVFQTYCGIEIENSKYYCIWSQRRDKEKNLIFIVCNQDIFSLIFSILVFI